MRILLFGAGSYYHLYKVWFSNEKVLAVLDNDHNKQGTYIDHILILSPEKYKEFEFDGIYILNCNVDEIRKQLLTLGVSIDKIYSYRDIYRTIKCPRLPVKHYCFENKADFKISCRKKNRICLISYNFGFNGGSIALFNMGKMLREIGYQVTVACHIDGPLREHYLQIGIDVIIDPNLLVTRLKDCDWLHEFNIIFLNSVILWYLLRDYDDCVPIIWWLHEPELLYRTEYLSGIPETQMPNVYVYGVGVRAQNPFLKRLPQWKVNILPIGIEDYHAQLRLDYFQEKIIFAVIGNFYKLKAQDVFLAAVELLPGNIKENCEFWLIGDGINDDYHRDIMERAKVIPEIKLLGSMPNDKVRELLRGVSILVCPSMEETCSIAIIEGMMQGIPCIVTDMTGISQYITQFHDGIVCPANNPQKMAKSLIWMVKHKKIHREMGGRAREVYEQNFSFDTFKRNLKDVLKKVTI